MTPKEQFLKGPHAKAFADICGTEMFREALRYSMAQLYERLPDERFDHRSYFTGVNALQKTLLSIAIPEEPDKTTAKPSLNHDAYDSPARRAISTAQQSKLNPTKPTA